MTQPNKKNKPEAPNIVKNIKKYAIFNPEGGLGKIIASTAIAKAIKDKYPDRTLIVVTPWPEVYLNNPAGTTVFHANTYCGSAHYKVSTDDWIGYPVRAMGTVTYMSEHNLVLQARVKNGGTLSFSWSGSDYRVVRVTEIRQ